MWDLASTEVAFVEAVCVGPGPLYITFSSCVATSSCT